MTFVTKVFTTVLPLINIYLTWLLNNHKYMNKLLR